MCRGQLNAQHFCICTAHLLAYNSSHFINVHFFRAWDLPHFGQVLEAMQKDKINTIVIVPLYPQVHEWPIGETTLTRKLT